jgi:2-dehydropantoate 2-reductase
MTEPPIIILGSGAMACFLAARLSFSGQKVCLVDNWIVGMEAIRENGITLRIDDQVIHQNMMTVLPNEVVPRCRLVVILVKSWQTSQAANRVFECLTPDGMALTLQNGLENDTILKNILGESRVAVGVTTLGATLISPGHVMGFETGSITVQDTPGIQDFLSIFKTAKLKISSDVSINRLVWEKLVINAAINPLTALLGIQNGKLLDNPNSLDLMAQIAREVINVSAHMKILLSYTDPMPQITAAARATAQNYSSMYQDVQRGAPTEIDQINGAVVQLGMQYGIPTPYNHCMVSMVKSMVNLNTLR